MYNSAMAYKDLTGLRFGRLTARAKLPSLRPRDGFRWECDCDCGNAVIVKTRMLTYKDGTKSCGCILAEKNRLRPVRGSTNLKHGHTTRGKPSPEYVCWSSMIQRCTNPGHESYKHYGARGIGVCKEWIDSFESFLRDIGPRPEKMSIDRIDPNLGYSKENCRWATNREQSLNRRNSRPVTAFGVSRTCDETSEEFGIPTRTLYRWASNGQDIGQQITAYLSKATRQSSV